MTVVVTRGDTGEGVVEEVRQLMGPTDVDLAKEDSPERYSNQDILTWVLSEVSCTNLDYQSHILFPSNTTAAFVPGLVPVQEKMPSMVVTVMKWQLEN